MSKQDVQAWKPKEVDNYTFPEWRLLRIEEEGQFYFSYQRWEDDEEVTVDEPISDALAFTLTDGIELVEAQ